MGNTKSPFLYDIFLDNPATSIRIYNPNYNRKAGEDPSQAKDRYNIITETSRKPNLEDRKYNVNIDEKSLLFTIPISNVSPGFNASNQWGSGAGGIISSLLDMGIDFLRGIVNPFTGQMAGGAVKLVGGAFGANEAKLNKISGGIKRAGNLNIYNASKLAKTYEGTTTNISGVDSLRFRLVSSKEDDNIIKQILKLASVSIGVDKDTITAIKDIFQGTESGNTTNEIDTGMPLLDSILNAGNSLIGVQEPPNGFTFDLTRGRTGPVIGSLVMMVSDFILIENLVVTNLSVTYSTQKVITKLGKLPLYADVDLSLEYGRQVTLGDIPKITPYF